MTLQEIYPDAWGAVFAFYRELREESEEEAAEHANRHCRLKWMYSHLGEDLPEEFRP